MDKDILLKVNKVCLKVDKEGIDSLNEEERDFYEYYLRINLYKKSPKGDNLKPIHFNLVELFKLRYDCIILNENLYIYDYWNGVYRIDEGGAIAKDFFKEQLEREFREEKTIQAVYSLLMSDGSLRVDDSKLNNRPKHWIHFKNCFYDPKTGKTHDFKKEYYEVNYINWDEPNEEFYPIDAKLVAPTKEEPQGFYIEKPLVFDEWIEKAIPDEDTRIMLFQYIAYAMTLDTSKQKFLVLTGQGGTGKSTLLNLIDEIIGKNNISYVSIHDLQERFNSSHLYMKQANICADLSSEALNQIDIIKKLTGEDVIQADRKYKSAFPFKSYARLFFSCNEVPQSLSDGTNAFYRRMLLIEMNYKPNHQDPHLLDKLREEIPNIINKCLYYYMESGMKIEESQTVIDAVHEARKESNSFIGFMDACIENEEEHKEARSIIYEEYLKYCRGEHMKALSRGKFYKALERSGFKQYKSHGTRLFVGLKCNAYEE